MGHAQTAQEGKAKTKRFSVWTLIFWLALVVFIVAAVLAGRIVYAYWHGQAEYETLAEDVLVVPDEEAIATIDSLTVDWETLQAVNSDIAAWLYVPGTVINYPVVWCGNDVTYLTKRFDGSEKSAVDYGTIFVEGKNRPDFSDEHNILFGHAMKNGTMFGLFYRMSWNGTFDTYRDIYLLTPQGNLHLKTFAYVWVPATELSILTTNFATPEERTAFIQDKIDRARFLPEEEIPAAADMEKVFSFITCDSAAGTGRYVLFAYVQESTIPTIRGYGQLDPNTPGIDEGIIDGVGR